MARSRFVVVVVVGLVAALLAVVSGPAAAQSDTVVVNDVIGVRELVESHGFTWVEPQTGGTVEVEERVYRGCSGVDPTGVPFFDPFDMTFEYVVLNVSYDPVPGVTNGFSGFQIVFPQAVPELYNQQSPAVGGPWQQNAFSGQFPPWGAEWDSPLPGVGILPGQTGVFSFCTWERFDVIVPAPDAGWMHTWGLEVPEPIVDADGSVSPFDGVPAWVEVTVGDPLASWLWPLSQYVEGLDWFDTDGSGAWSFGDDLHVEDPTTHPGAIRNGLHDDGRDPLVLDWDGSLDLPPNQEPVDCDMETGTFCPVTMPGEMKWFDTNLNGRWDDGEDIVLDSDLDGVFGLIENTQTWVVNVDNSVPGRLVPRIDIEKLTNGADADGPPGPPVWAGNPVTWTYVVTNPDHVPLSGVTVWDDHLGVIPGPDSGDVNGDGLLDPGETWVYTAHGVAEVGQYANWGVATGFGPQEDEVVDRDPSHYLGRVSAGIDLEKSTNGEDADEAPGPSVTVGDTVEWTYEVTNTGEHPVGEVSVWDDRIGTIPGPEAGDGNGNGMLDPGETWVYRASGVAGPGQYGNKGAAGATAPDGVRLRHDDWSHYFGVLPPVGIDVEKATNGHDADAPPGPALAMGTPIEWTYLVTNPAGTPLADVTVHDDRLGLIPGPDAGDVNGNELLDPGESWVYVTHGVARYGPYANTATVRGVDEWGRSVDDSDHSHYTGRLPVAAIDVEKHTNGDDADGPTGPLVQVGDAVEWTYVVSNPGDVPLRRVVLRDGRTVIEGPDSGDDNANGMLDPSETWVYTRDGVAVAGQHRNDATVRGTTPWWRTVTDTDPSHYLGVIPVFDLAIDKSGPAYAPAGSSITYGYTVTNSGPASVIPRVRDDTCAPVENLDGDVDGDGRIGPTETWTYGCTWQPPVLPVHHNRGFVDAVGPNGLPIPGDTDTSNNVAAWTTWTGPAEPVVVRARVVASPPAATVGDEVVVTATTYDEGGNVVVEPGVGMRLGLRGREQSFEAVAVRLGDGRYEAHFTIDAAGWFTPTGLATSEVSGVKRPDIEVTVGDPVQVNADIPVELVSLQLTSVEPLTVRLHGGQADTLGNGVPLPDLGPIEVTPLAPGIEVLPPLVDGDRFVVPLTTTEYTAGKVEVGFGGGPAETFDVFFAPAELRVVDEVGTGPGPASDGAMSVEMDLQLPPTVAVESFDATFGMTIPPGVMFDGCRSLDPAVVVTCSPPIFSEIAGLIVQVGGTAVGPLAPGRRPVVALDLIYPVGLVGNGAVSLLGLTLYDPLGLSILYPGVFLSYWWVPFVIKPVKTLTMHVYIVEGAATQAQVEADITAAENGFNGNALACRCPFYVDFVPKFTVIPKADWDDIDEDGDGLDRYDSNGDGDYADPGDNNDLFNAMLKDYYDVSANTENVYYVPGIRGGAMGSTYWPNQQVAVDNGADGDNLTLFHEKVHEMDLRDDGDFDVNDSPDDAGNAQGARNNGNIMNYDNTGTDLTKTQCDHLDP